MVFDVITLSLLSKFHINSTFSGAIGAIESIIQKGFEKKSGNRKKALLGFHKHTETGLSRKLEILFAHHVKEIQGT